MSTRIIGVHSGHDASACLLVDNVLVGAIARERLTRRKHDHGDPVECVDYLLAHFGLAPADIDLLVRSDWHDATGLREDRYCRFARVEKTRRHHLLHAYAASVAAPAEPSLVLVADGRGCRPEDNGVAGMDPGLFEIESVYRHEDGRLTALEKTYRPYYNKRYAWGSHIDSLGYAYAAVSKKIFGSSHAAGKVMALAALATRAHDIPAPLRFGRDQSFGVNPDWLAFLQACPDHINWDTPLAADLADAIQQGLEAYLAFRTQQLAQAHQCRDLLLGGGVALNCRNNGLLANAAWLRSVDIFPAAGDDGLSVGAAVMALRETFGDYRPIVYRVSQGASYAAPMAQEGQAAQALARLLADGHAVGVFQGGSEFGPRALGYRSILSSAADLALKTRLNARIKRRESFRPFGGIVLRSNLDQLTGDALAGPNMLSAAQMTDASRARYPALAHVDGSVRLQVVEEDGCLLHQVLVAYEDLTGRVALINTSFNGRDEPIVETLAQARACAAAIGLGHLYAHGAVEDVHA
ncbi:carbamoyltransferase C-terminal domain-containing protein [Burkholderia sp. BCC1644]|uniref:carbamoyltransferase C-terminal domain-containing protein n=1 Tax=Burkholderia sp. BCC1644 TaxID=2676293 RepID=UPI001590438D|nr:carbamoyltransferase C-terminal domain-containing protein [Burkholderia sp. BCC1644]